VVGFAGAGKGQAIPFNRGIECLTLGGSDKFESNCPSANNFIFPGAVL
jgi:hypothetical protein